jgi:glutamate carboxypeptidase
VPAITPARSTAPRVTDLRLLAEARLPRFGSELAALVSIDSGSWNASGVDEVGRWCADRMRAAGFAVERIPTPLVDGRRLGDVVVARHAGRGIRRVMLFAHLDTVFAEGTAGRRPFREERGRAFGPGVSDDKGGLLAAIHVADVLAEAGFDDLAELVLVFSPDEEIGSPASRAIVAGIAAGMDAAFCMECARENGDLVTERKGVADVRIEIRGRAAHSGVEPDRGANAAVEAAHLLLELHALSGTRPGLTVNIGVLEAGDRANIVPSAARLLGEVRAATLGDLEATLDAIELRAAHPVVAGVTIDAVRVAVCPPLERSSGADALLALAAEVGAELGLAVRGAATGGASDANYVASAGIPVLDGLGPIGGDDHSPTEWLDLGSVPERVALLAGLIVRVAAE